MRAGEYYLGRKLAGESCIDDDECFYTKCVDGSCKGDEEGDRCLSTYECGVGLYCNTAGRCAPLRQEGEACTEDKDLCANGHVCNMGYCAQIFSLKPGSYADNPYACMYFDLFDGVCGEGFLNVANKTKPWDTPCNPGKLCRYESPTDGRV